MAGAFKIIASMFGYRPPKFINRRRNRFENISKSKILGYEGEFLVNQELNKLDRFNYIVIDNLTILNNNTTHQIDHVVVSNFGIFVIETKNYSGFVKGADKYSSWTHYIGRRKYHFMNPITQNKGHIKALCSIYPEYSDYFVPIVCFSNKTKLNVGTSYIVVNLRNLLNVIKSYKTEVLISNIHEVAQHIKNSSIDLNGITEDHIRNVNKYR